MVLSDRPSDRRLITIIKISVYDLEEGKSDLLVPVPGTDLLFDERVQGTGTTQ
jgi:hypothetical protein